MEEKVHQPPIGEIYVFPHFDESKTLQENIDAYESKENRIDRRLRCPELRGMETSGNYPNDTNVDLKETEMKKPGNAENGHAIIKKKSEPTDPDYKQYEHDFGNACYAFDYPEGWEGERITPQESKENLAALIAEDEAIKNKATS